MFSVTEISAYLVIIVVIIIIIIIIHVVPDKGPLNVCARACVMW